MLLYIGLRFDYVQILDQNQKLVGTKICGRKSDLKIEVPGTTAYVVFHSDEEATEEGFQATFEAISPPKPASKGWTSHSVYIGNTHATFCILICTYQIHYYNS